jgi:6-methylsalicylate decarboxylase
MHIDVHQHIWTEPLIEALATRRELPFVRSEHGLTVLYMADERPFVLDLSTESYEHRAGLVALDGLDHALVCLSSPLGIESLPREQSTPLLDAYHDGALALGEPFGVWGALALDRPDASDIDYLLDRGCVGVSLPAGALASTQSLARLQPILARLESRGAPLLVHPGPGPGHGHSLRASTRTHEPSLEDPLWWQALTRYVFDMHAAWLALLAAGRTAHPRLRVVHTMLAGLAPLQHERLAARGGLVYVPDPLTFYDTSSYGPSAIRALAERVGPEQLLYGSDRPVVEPDPAPVREALGFDLRAHSAAAAQRVFAFAGQADHDVAGRGTDRELTASRGSTPRGSSPEGPASRTPAPRTPATRTPEAALR